MKSTWLVLMGAIALIFAVVVQAEALNFADDVCPDAGGTEFVVDTAAKALVVQNGYNRDPCNLIIKISMNPNEADTLIKAKTISILGDGVTPLNIINAAVSGDIIFSAVGGNILIQNAIVKARDTLKLLCDSAGCRIDVDDSSIIASASLDPFNVPGDPSSGFATKGELFISAKGNIDLQRSDIYGGSGLHMSSDLGGITWFCPGPGLAGCLDPTKAPSNVDKLLCGDPPVYPCTVTFNSKEELKGVCFPGTPGRICGGGSKEIRLSARLDIDIQGSTIIALDHITFSSDLGSLLAGPKGGSPSVINAQDSLVVSVRKSVDMPEAQWTATTIIVSTGPGCVAGDPGYCINAQKADMEANLINFKANNALGDIDVCEATLTVLGAGLPTLNSDATPPYGPNVRDTTAECTPLGPLQAF